jgi:hypothetical protein
VSDVRVPTEQELVPFYSAVGKAITRWQSVESGLFVVMHAILGIDSKLSSVIFFQFQGAGAKIALVDRLCETHLTSDALAEWNELLKDVKAGLPFRNAIAHWETNIVSDPSLVALGEPPVALSRHHLDIRSEGDPKSVNTGTAIAVAEEYLLLARRLLGFVVAHFSVDKLRETNLQPRLLEYLEKIAKSPPAPPTPPPSRSPNRSAMRLSLRHAPFRCGAAHTRPSHPVSCQGTRIEIWRIG